MKIPEDPVQLRNHCLDLHSRLNNFNNEKSQLEESLRSQILSNEQQRNYIQIMKNALQAKIQDLGIIRNNNPQQRTSSRMSRGAPSAPLNDAAVDLFIQLTQAKEQSQKHLRNVTKLQNQLGESQQLLKESDQQRLSLTQQNEALHRDIQTLEMQAKQKTQRLQNDKESLLEFVDQAIKKQEQLQNQKAELNEQIQNVIKARDDVQLNLNQIHKNLNKKQIELQSLKRTATLHENQQKQSVKSQTLEIEIDKLRQNISLNEEFIDEQNKKIKELQQTHSNETDLWKKKYDNDIDAKNIHISRQKGQIQNYVKQIDTLRQQTATFKSQNQDLKRQIQENQRVIQDTRRQRQSIQNKLSRMMEEHQSERMKLAASNNQIKNRENQISARVIQLNTALQSEQYKALNSQTEKDQLQREIARITSSNKLLQGKLDDIQFQLKKQIKKTEVAEKEQLDEADRLRRVESYVQQLEQQQKRYADIIKEREGACNQMSDQIRQLQTDKSQYLRDVEDASNLRNKVGYLQNQLQAASVLQAQHQGKVNKIMDQNEALLTQVSKLENQLRVTQTQLHSISLEAQSSRLQKTELELRYQEVNGPFSQLRTAVNEALASVNSFLISFHASGLCEMVSQRFTQVVHRDFEDATLLKPEGDPFALARAAQRLAQWVDLLHGEIEDSGRFMSNLKVENRLKSDRLEATEAKCKMLNDEQRLAMEKERERKGEINRLQEQVKILKHEKDSAYQREEKIHRQNHQLNDKVQQMERNLKELGQRSRSAQQAKTEMEKNFLGILDVEKKNNRATKVMEERLSGVQNELTDTLDVASLLMEFIDVSIIQYINFKQGSDNSKMLAAELIQNVKEVSCLRKDQIRNQRRIQDLEEQIQNTSKLNYQEENNDSQYRGRMKLREQIRQLNDLIYQNKPQLDKLARHREKLISNLQQEKRNMQKRLQQIDKSTDQIQSLHYQLQQARNEINRIQDQKAQLAITCASLEQRSILKDRQIRNMKDDTLYARTHNCSISSISAERSTSKDRNYLPQHHHHPLRNLSQSTKRKKNNDTRRASRQDNTPLRDKHAAYRSSQLPPLYFGNGNNSYPSIILDDDKKVLPSTSQVARIDSSQATPRASGAGGISFQQQQQQQYHRTHEQITFRPPPSVTGSTTDLSRNLMNRQSFANSRQGSNKNIQMRRCSHEGSQNSTRLKERLQEAKNTFSTIRRQYLEEELTGSEDRRSKKKY